MLRPKPDPGETTLERAADLVSQRFTRRRYERTPALTQVRARPGQRGPCRATLSARVAGAVGRTRKYVHLQSRKNCKCHNHKDISDLKYFNVICIIF